MMKFTFNELCNLASTYLHEQRMVNPTHKYVNQYGREEEIEIRRIVEADQIGELCVYVGDEPRHAGWMSKEKFFKITEEIREWDLKNETSIFVPANGQSEFVF